MKLIGFGCSNTAKLIDKLVTWPEAFENKTGIKSINLAEQGSSNNYILQTIINNLDKIEDGDIVVVQLSYFNRAIWHTTNTKKMYTNHYITEDDITKIRTTKNLYNEYYFAVCEYLYPSVVFTILDLLNYLKKEKNIIYRIFCYESFYQSNIFWFYDLLNSKEFINFDNRLSLIDYSEYAVRFKKIKDEFPEENDDHFGNDAHNFLADKIIDSLNLEIKWEKN